MRQLPLFAAVLLVLPASAQTLPDLKLKDGLWEERTTSTMHPAETSSTFTQQQCHSQTYDARERQRALAEQQQTCRILASDQSENTFTLEESCQIPAPTGAGVNAHLKMAVELVDESHTVATVETAYSRNMPSGFTGATTREEMTFLGPCNPGMKPGDKLETLPNGKTMVIPAPILPDLTPMSSRGVRVDPGHSRLLSSGPAASAGQPLNQRPAPFSITHPTGPAITNADVIALASAGMDDAVILAKIQSASSSKFDTSIDGLKALKAGGVSNAVIKIIVSTAASADAETAANSDDPNVMHQPGVYALVSGRDGQVHLLQLEHTHAAGENSSGNSLTMAYHLSKKHIRESLNNATSPVKIEDRNPTFYIYIPQDTQSFGGNDLSARDFELLKLRVKSKTREVETSSTSITGMGASGIEDKARQNTVAQKVKPGIYMVKMSAPLKPGEYAFQHELEGVFYDFTIIESR